MYAFITTIKELLVLDTDGNDGENFKEEIKAIKIPLYQREYKWEEDRIRSLLLDISKRDKLLGYVILDEKDTCYEIVDGQQRITTCYLLLANLFNYYKGSPMEQESIKKIMKPYGRFVLENDSIGEYLHEDQDEIRLDISPEKDIYYQKDAFDKADSNIKACLAEAEILSTNEKVREFKEKLLNCTVLVLINQRRDSTSTEQIFLDINEKAKLLDTEDIFKGHCFENFEKDRHQSLRDTWAELKKYGAQFLKFGVQSLGKYIYYFLLEHDDKTLPEKLNPKGVHYLDGKTMDETNRLLGDMICYGKAIDEFYQNIQLLGYCFEDIASNSREYRNTNDHIALKAMAKEVLDGGGSAVYQKLPFMYFLYMSSAEKSIREEMTHDQLRRIITNLYIYSIGFSLSKEKKRKQKIDHTVRDAIRTQTNRSKNIVEAAKALRNLHIKDLHMPDTAGFEVVSSLYSILDNYVANENWIPLVYTKEGGYNLEHFIVPGGSKSIKWKDEGGVKTIPLDAVAIQRKREPFNYLIIDKSLNEDLEVDDIVSKIRQIKDWYRNRDAELPKHIQIIIDNIEELDKYQALVKLKAESAPIESLIPSYHQFIFAYFDPVNIGNLHEQLKDAFSEVFHN